MVFNNKLGKYNETDYSKQIYFFVFFIILNQNEKGSFEDAHNYEQIYILEAVLFILILYKLLSVFRRYLPLQIIMSSIERAALTLVIYSIALLPVLCTFAIIFKNLLGAFMPEYSTFLKSILTLMYMIVGHGKTVSITFFSRDYGVIFLILFYIFTLHFMIVSFAAIYLSSFRYTIDAYGYPYDERQSKKWGFKELVKWVVSWLPEKCLVMLNLQESLSSGVVKKREEEEEKKEETKNPAA